MSAIHSEIMSATSFEMKDWLAHYAEKSLSMAKEYHVPEDLVLPDELVTMMNQYSALPYNLSVHEMYDKLDVLCIQAFKLSEQYEDDYNLGKIPKYISYIAYNFAYKLKDRSLSLLSYVQSKKQCPKWVSLYVDLDEEEYEELPRWTTEREYPQETSNTIHDWAEDDEEQPTTEQLNNIYDEWESSGPSLFRFDQEIPITSYLHSEDNAKLFMSVMFENNEWKFSYLIPDRLYKYLPEELREIVDLLTNILSVGLVVHDNLYSKFKFENQNIPLELEIMSQQVKEYLANQDLPFAYVYLAKFILKKINEFPIIPHY
jgi:hypothetical protein